MVLCWVDAGLSVGLGPVSRGLALAEALAGYGLPCRLALAPDTTALAWLRLAGARPPVLLPEDEPALPRLLAAAGRVAAVIVDLKRPLTSTEAHALGAGRRLLVIDNGNASGAAADLVVAPLGCGAERDGRELRPEGGRSPQWLVGPAYVPLRRVFRLAGDLRGARPSPPVVLVSMGRATRPASRCRRSRGWRWLASTPRRSRCGWSPIDARRCGSASPACCAGSTRTRSRRSAPTTW